MGYQTKTANVKKVPLSAGYSAMVQVLRSEDEDAIQAAFLGSAKSHGKLTQDAENGARTEVEQDMDTSALVRETLLRGIVSWDLDDDAGQPLPLNAATLRILTSGDRNLLFKEIQAMSAPLTAGE